MASKEQRDAAIQGASSRVSSGCMYCGDRTAEVEALRAERDRYRQGLIDCATQAGADVSDGPPDWPALEAWAVRAVREMRETFEADL